MNDKLFRRLPPRERAAGFLYLKLKDGAKPSDWVREEAKAWRITEPMLDRALIDLGCYGYFSSTDVMMVALECEVPVELVPLENRRDHAKRDIRRSRLDTKHGRDPHWFFKKYKPKTEWP